MHAGILFLKTTLLRILLCQGTLVKMIKIVKRKAKQFLVSMLYVLLGFLVVALHRKESIYFWERFLLIFHFLNLQIFIMDCKANFVVSWCLRQIEWLTRQYFEIIHILPSEIILLLSYFKTIVTRYLFFRIPCQKWDRVHLHYLVTWQRLVFSMLDPVLVSVTMTETIFFPFH